MANITRPYVTCPKCGSAELRIIETSEAYETWVQDENGKIEDNDDGALLGKVLRVEAECMNEECPAREDDKGFRWTLRRISDVTELPNWDNGEEDEQPKTDEEEASGDEEETAEAEEETEAEAEAEPEEETTEEEDEGETEEEVASQPEPEPAPAKKPKGKDKSAKGKKDEADKKKAGGKNRGRRAA